MKCRTAIRRAFRRGSVRCGISEEICHLEQALRSIPVTNGKKKCYIYTRVSTAAQTEGYSLDAQKERLR